MADWKFAQNAWKKGTSVKHKLFGTALGLKSLLRYKINQSVPKMERKQLNKIIKKVKKTKKPRTLKRKEVKAIKRVGSKLARVSFKNNPKKMAMRNTFGRSMVVPTAIGSNYTYKNKRQSGSTLVTGSFILSNINNNNVQWNKGTTIVTSFIDQTMFNGTRVSPFFKIFEKWGGLVIFEYVTSSSTQVGGNLIMGIDRDPGDQIYTGDISQSVSQLRSAKSFVRWSSSSTVSITKSNLFCSDQLDDRAAERRQTAMGQFYLSNESTIEASLSDVGLIRCHYRLNFKDPVYEADLSTVDGWQVTTNTSTLATGLEFWSQFLGSPSVTEGNQLVRIFPGQSSLPSVISFEFLKPGIYQMHMTLPTVTTTSSGSWGVSVINCSTIPGYSSSALNSVSMPLGINRAIFTCRVTVVSELATITFSYAGGTASVPSSNTFSQLIVMKVGDFKKNNSIQYQINELQQKLSELVVQNLGKQEKEDDEEDVIIISKNQYKKGTFTPPNK